jgi:hypothetical protein
MSATLQQRTRVERVETPIFAREAWLELLLQKPATRLLYRASKAAYPLFTLPCEVEISFAPHGFQHVSAARGPRIWARVINALEDQHRLEEVLKIEQELIERYGDCRAKKGPAR